MSFLNFLRVALVSALLLTSVNGACLSPKVRREWRSISSAERTAWLNAIQCLAKRPHDPRVTPTVNASLSLIPPVVSNSSRYDDFVFAHMDLNVLIHGTGFFLPWHRQYVQAFENELRTKCGYSGVHPYWDWTLDAADFYHATIFSNSTSEGLGSWGDPANDYQINTGGLKDIMLAYPVPHHIRRNYTNLLDPAGFPGAPPVNLPATVNISFTQANVDYTLTSFDGDYDNFQGYLENFPGPHPGPHVILGGDMSGLCPDGLGPANGCYSGQKWSPNDPMFFLHHAMIDRIWYQWQLRSSTNKNAFGGGSISIQVDPVATAGLPNGAPPNLNLSSVIPADTLWGNVAVQDVMDTKGGNLCYIYT